jgi:hypothetical protein
MSSHATCMRRMIQTNHDRNRDYTCAHGVGELNIWRQAVPENPHEAVVDPHLQPLVLASHAASHFVIRGATRTLRYLRRFQHPTRRSLLAGSLWSSRTSSASDKFSSGVKPAWLSRPSALVLLVAPRVSAVGPGATCSAPGFGRWPRRCPGANYSLPGLGRRPRCCL